MPPVGRITHIRRRRSTHGCLLHVQNWREFPGTLPRDRLIAWQVLASSGREHTDHYIRSGRPVSERVIELAAVLLLMLVQWLVCGMALV